MASCQGSAESACPYGERGLKETALAFVPAGTMGSVSPSCSLKTPGLNEPPAPFAGGGGRNLSNRITFLKPHVGHIVHGASWGTCAKQ